MTYSKKTSIEIWQIIDGQIRGKDIVLQGTENWLRQDVMVKAWDTLMEKTECLHDLECGCCDDEVEDFMKVLGLLEEDKAGKPDSVTQNRISARPSQSLCEEEEPLINGTNTSQKVLNDSSSSPKKTCNCFIDEDENGNCPCLCHKDKKGRT